MLFVKCLGHDITIFILGNCLIPIFNFLVNKALIHTSFVEASIGAISVTVSVAVKIVTKTRKIRIKETFKMNRVSLKDEIPARNYGIFRGFFRNIPPEFAKRRNVHEGP
jgi:hypothetical protein